MNKNIPQFEALSAASASQLTGGFSMAVGLSDITDPGSSNNCKGGNCKTGCGKKTKLKPSSAPNDNCTGNCVKGCGEAKKT